MSVTNADQVLRYKGFNVEIKGVDNTPADVDGAWVALSGGQLDDKDNGHAAPGKALVSEVTLVGPLTPGRKSMLRWFKDTVNGGSRYRTVTVTLTPFDPKQARETLIFEDAYITGYVFPPLVLDDPCPPELVEELRFGYARLVRL